VSLLPQHLADLRKSGLTDETIAACRFRSVADETEAGRILNWRGPARGLGPFLAIPFFDLDGKSNCFIRLKPDRPRASKKGGKTVKYESPVGKSNRAYFPPGTVAVLADPTAPLVVTEGEKKSLKAAQEGFPCVGLVGVYGFHKRRPKGEDGKPKGPRVLIDDLAAVAWGGRTVFVCYDSDLADKPEVAAAEWCLAEVLRERGAVVKVVRLPAGPRGEKQGLDDYLVAHGADAFRRLLKAARAPRKPRRRKAEAAAGPAASEVRLHLTDLGNAVRLKERHGADLLHCHPWGEWLVWDDKRWRRDDRGEVQRRAASTALSIYGEAERCPDPRRRAELAEHAVASESARSIRAMVELARSAVPVLPEQLDADPMLLNVLNGTLDLRTAALRPHRREDLITKIAPVEFHEDAACPLWCKCLDRWMGGNKALVGYLQRVVGYCLTGDVSEQAMWFFHGAGANGKSTFLGALLWLLGEYAMQAVSELLMVKSHEAHPTERADLFGKRFVATIETEEGKRMAEALMKQLTGGDNVRARKMRQDFFEFAATHKIALAANHKPAVKGTDLAVWRRIKLVPFTVTIPEVEKDKALPEKLKAEASGVLSWCVAGCLDWQRHGLQEPPEVTRATAEYRKEQDTVALFVAECCFVHPTARAGAAALLEAYQKWSGDRSMTPYAFARRLEASGFEGKKLESGKFYLGIGLPDPSKNTGNDGL
jgi:putative DNA primase/helicase